MATRGEKFQSGPLDGYRKIRKLGAGGMAETYLCVRREPGEPGDPRTRKTTIEDRACCKRLLPACDDRPEFRADLEREAAIVATLRHSNITQLRGWNLAERELYFELVDGCDLRQLVANAPGKRLPAPLVTLIGIELCKALAYAHSRTRRGKPAGIVHRDISPSNVMISYAGEVKLTDFGLAAVVALEQRAGEPLSGVVRGKLAYMAPEQARGDRYVDHRADLFSLGVMFYELLSGRRPASGTEDEIYAALSAGQHTPLRELVPEVPDALDRIVERAFRPNPAARFQSADELLDALCVLAPPHNLFRELGELARHAVPPETLTYDAELFRDDEASAVEPNVAAVHAAASLDVDTPPIESQAQRPQRDAARRPMRWAGAATVLSGLAAAAFVLPAGGAKPASAPAPAEKAAPATTAQTSEAPAEPPVTEPANGGVEPRVLASAPPSPAPPSEPTPRPSAEATATLRVGVVPIAQVWVDGRYLGWSWSPITVKLNPNVDHAVAAGETKAEVTKTVRLAAGERRAITLHLPKQ